MYVQYSRFELFGISMVEALACEMPVLVSEQCDLASELSMQGAAIQIPMDPEKAAEIVIRKLCRPEELERRGRNGRKWTIRECEPTNIAHQMTEFYKRIINE